MTNSYRKEYPFAGYAGFGGGAPGLSFKSAATKKYIDDIFSPYVWAGNNTIGRDIVNNIDLADKGGMVWAKKRELEDHIIVDTVRGANNFLLANTNAAQSTSNSISAFNSNGFTVDNNGYVNGNASTYVGWTFAKQEGFFDIVQFSGDGNSSQTISHSLGSVPGVVMVKRTDSSDNWNVYHRSTGEHKALFLNGAGYAEDDPKFWNDTVPTSTEFTVGDDTGMNASGGTYVAYLFAGGESTADTATSVYTESSGYLGLDQSTDFDLGTSDFTIEAWVRPRTGDRSGSTFNILSFGYPFNLYYVADASVPYSGKFTWDGSTSNSTNNQTMGGYTPANSVEQNQWNHVALTRSGSTFKFFLNGTLKHTDTSSSAFGTNAVHGCKIGYGTPAGSQYFQGDVSNVRYVLGTALYTDSFKVPTEPLSNVTNTKLLCCQGSATDSATVSPGTITPYNSPSWKAYSPFDDSDGFKFGADEDQNIIKCSSYIGNASADGPEINLGWEPQWILLKRVAGGSGNWTLLDCMRGIVTAGNDMMLKPNSNDGETTSNDYIELTPRGFRVKATYDQVNASGDTYIYIAIRRPDGYVAKPAEAGTDVFAMDTGEGVTTIPNFDSGFPVDFAFIKEVASTGDYYAGTRLMGHKYLITNTTQAQSADATGWDWDSNEGFEAGGYTSTWQGWMWKRGQGLDVVTYTGNGTSTGDTQKIPHGLNQIPEMAWIKNRGATQDWGVYHKDMHSSIPQLYYMKLNTTDTRIYDNQTFDTPTATHFNLRHNAIVNQNNAEFVMMLFSSVSGISKVGNYTGTGSTGLSVDVGFQPRFILFRGTGMGGPWRVLDSVRGMSSGNDSSLSLNSTAAAVTNFDWLDVTSTGFTINTTDGEANASGENYIYYAHA